jgi:hypothetical protein
VTVWLRDPTVPCRSGCLRTWGGGLTGRRHNHRRRLLGRLVNPNRFSSWPGASAFTNLVPFLDALV